MTKVVLDTNVLINATQDEFAYEKRIIDEVIKGNIQAYGTNPMIRENQLILDQYVPDPKQKEFLNQYFAYLEEVPIRFHHKIIEWDSDDDKFINAALSAEADYIISSDAHLLDHDGFEGLKIMKPKDFWAVYKQDDDEEARSWMLDLMKS